MTPIILVEITDLQNYKLVCDSVKNHASWPMFVWEAQMLDVKHWLGDGLLNELLTQAVTSPPSFTTENTLLLDGGTYTYNSRTYMFQGLKACIMYYAFARFTNRTAYNYTAAGIVVKESDFSTPVTDKVTQRLETEARLTADALKCEVVTFLNRNAADYPLWADFCKCSTRCNDFRFKVIGD